MNYIFTGYNNTISPQISFRNVEKIPASGTTLLFASTFVEKSRSSKPSSSFVSSLLQFVGILRLKHIPYSTCSELTPWAMPRYLQVSRLPDPVFQSYPPAKALYPQILEQDQYNRYPIIPDMKEEEPEIIMDCGQTMKGVLKQDETGLIYLDISTNFAIPEKESESVPTLIPVISSQEAKEKAGWGPIKELGMTFSFKLLNLCSLKPLLWPEIEKVYFFTLDSAELNALREKHLLPGKKSLYMTIGVKRRKTPSHSHPQLYRLNVSCNAA